VENVVVQFCGAADGEAGSFDLSDADTDDAKIADPQIAAASAFIFWISLRLEERSVE